MNLIPLPDSVPNHGLELVELVRALVHYRTCAMICEWDGLRLLRTRTRSVSRTVVLLAAEMAVHVHMCSHELIEHKSTTYTDTACASLAACLVYNSAKLIT